MTVHHRLHVRSRAIDLGVDEALEVHAPPARVERGALEVERDDVVAPDEARRHVARQQEMARRAIVPRADVPETVDHALPIQDAIGKDDLVDERGRGGGRHGCGGDRRCNLA